MPIDWKERGAGAERRTLATTPRLLKRRSDPWTEYWNSKQKVTKAAVAALRHLGLSAKEL
jgi:DNA primase